MDMKMKIKFLRACSFAVTFFLTTGLFSAPLLAGVVVAGEADVKPALDLVPTAPPALLTTRVPLAKAKQARKNPSIDEIDEIAATDNKKGKKYVMRCWQNGQLILERRINDLPPESGKAVALDGGRNGVDADSRGGMRLFDLRNATCLLQ